MTYRLLTIDLDDTLWPCAPVIEAAEAALHAWLTRAAPRLVAVHDPASLSRHRRALMAAHPARAHDLSWVRHQSLVELLVDFGYDPALADQGLALFLEHRQQVVPFADVVPALEVLAESCRLVSITNGNADVTRSPLRDLFDLSLTAAAVGAAKPDPAMFHRALDWAGVSADQALHIGDDPYLDVAAARDLGFATVWVNRSGQAWPAALAPPSRIVGDLGELVPWLTGDDDAF